MLKNLTKAEFRQKQNLPKTWTVILLDTKRKIFCRCSPTPRGIQKWHLSFLSKCFQKQFWLTSTSPYKHNFQVSRCLDCTQISLNQMVLESCYFIWVSFCGVNQDKIILFLKVKQVKTGKIFPYPPLCGRNLTFSGNFTFFDCILSVSPPYQKNWELNTFFFLGLGMELLLLIINIVKASSEYHFKWADCLY